MIEKKKLDVGNQPWKPDRRFHGWIGPIGERANLRLTPNHGLVDLKEVCFNLKLERLLYSADLVSAAFRMPHDTVVSDA
jgi:hypothetical protein